GGSATEVRNELSGNADAAPCHRSRTTSPPSATNVTCGPTRTTRNKELKYSAYQLAYGFAVIEQVLWPAIEVGKRDGRVDAERVVDGGDDVLEGNFTVFGAFGAGVGRADHVAHAQAAAEKQHAPGIRPVLASGTRLSDLRRPTELAE